MLGAQAHQDLPIEKLDEELFPGRESKRDALFQVLFELRNSFAQPLKMHGLSVSPLKMDWRTTRVDLHMIVDKTEHGIEGCIEYNPDLFEQLTIRRVLVSFDALLTGCV